MDVRRYALLVATALAMAACNQEPKFSTDQFIPASDQSGKPCTNQVVPQKFVVQWNDGHFSVEEAESQERFIEEKLRPHSLQIRRAEPAYKLHVLQSAPPTSSPPDATWGTEIVKASAAWNKNVKGAGVIVAVVDTGADINHPQLAGQIYTNQAEAHGKTGVDDDNNGFVDDVHGWNFANNAPLTGDNDVHGTHVSGIIAADPTKGSVQGMAPQASILPVAFLDSTGSGTTPNAILGIQYAMQMGARVVNASWGGGDCSILLEDAIRQLGDHNAMFVAAAGNDSLNIDQNPAYPASYAADNLLNMITVAASDWMDMQAGFSNDGNTSVHLAAPGMDITSTIPVSDGGTAVMSGTSMATPFVSGAVALLMSDRPKATVEQVRQAIFSSVDAGPFMVYTRGRLDVQGALQALESTVAP